MQHSLPSTLRAIIIAPHVVFIPAIFLSITVLAINLLGDGLRDVLDPRTGD